MKVPVPGLNTFPEISIDVQAGDVIGLFSPAGGEWCVLDAGYAVHQAGSDLAPGATATFCRTPAVQLNSRKPRGGLRRRQPRRRDRGPELPVERRAADADPPPATPPPDTTIASGPEGKTKSKTRDASVQRHRREAVASFQCKLDSALRDLRLADDSGLKKGTHTSRCARGRRRQRRPDAGVADLEGQEEEKKKRPPYGERRDDVDLVRDRVVDVGRHELRARASWSQ